MSNDRRSMPRFTAIPATALGLLLIGAGPQPARATDVCGEVCDETWPIVASPFTATCDIVVPAGCSLTIEPGVEVGFEADVEFTVEGQLDISGIVIHEVVLQSASATPSPGDWVGLQLASGSEATLSHVRILHGNGGVRAYDTTSTVLEHVTLRENRTGLEVSGTSSVDASWCTITDNSQSGIQLWSPVDGALTLTRSSIHDNGGEYDYDFDASDTTPGQTFLARENWWGTPDPLAITSRIWDAADSNTRGTVDWCGYLNNTPDFGVPARDAHCPDLFVCDGTVAWGLNDKPYQLVSDVFICPTGVVEIGPGVDVRAVPGTPSLPAGVDIRVEGALEVNGTAGAPVSLTSDAAIQTIGEWGGLILAGGGTATIDHAAITYAGTGIEIAALGNALLNNVTLGWNENGFHFDCLSGCRDSVVQASGCSITHNQSAGIAATGGVIGGDYGPSVSISGSSIHSNGDGTDVSTERYIALFIDARYNWWNTIDPLEIASRFSGGGLYVNWCGWLDDAPPMGSRVRSDHCPDLDVCDETAVWDATDEPYLIVSPMVVCDTGSLTIGPGVEVRALVPSSYGAIRVHGGLDVNGELASPVSFGSDAAAPVAGDWGGLSFHPGSVGTIEHATILHAFRGVTAYQSASVTLNGVTAQENEVGLHVNGYEPMVVNASGCTFTGNEQYGIEIEQDSDQPDPVVTVSGSSIHSNLGTHDLFVAAEFETPDSTVIEARGNWWGIDDPNVIAARIHDHTDDADSARVEWCAYLDGPGGIAPDVECPEFEICDGITVWDRTDRPYQITGNVYVCPTGTLEVKPGVDVRFVKTSPRLTFEVEGVLDVNGTAGSPVLLTSAAGAPEPEDWQGLRLTTGSTSDLEHATIDHAVNAVHVYDTAATLDHVETTNSTRGVYVEGDATVDISHLTSRFNTDGLFVYDGNSTVTVTGSTLTHNNRYGVYLNGDVITTAPQVNISGSSIHSNLAAYDLYTYRFQNAGQEVVLARDNWWGTPVATAISSRIYDYRRSTQSPLVDFCGWLDVEGGAPVRDAECPDLAICGETADWTVTTRPYLLTCDLRICSTGTLNVGPGVEVRSVLASPRLDFDNQGVLAVGGTEGGEVRFTSDADTPGADDWSGLRLRPGSTNTIERATIDHAVNAVHVYDTAATLDHVETTNSTRGVYVEGDATVDISHLTSRFNTDGLFVYDGNSTVTVTGSTLTHNNRYGVYLNGDVITTAPQVNISGSSIHSNLAAYDLYTYRFQNAGQEVVLARDNWWGTPVATAISSRIYDYRRSTQSPLVDFCGWLDVEGGAPVRDAECPDLAICGETADWTVTTRPYLLTCDLRICSTGTLNVGPGVEVRSVLASPRLDFDNQGVLAVGGTEGGEVRFTSDADTPGADDWSGLRLRPGSTNTIERATIDHAVNAVHVYDTSATLDHVKTTHSTRGVYVQGDATVDVHDLTSRFNTDGLYVYDGNSTVTVTGSTLTGNNRYGVYLNGDVLTTAPQVNISGSSIHSNLAAYDLYTYRFQNAGQEVVLARDNWWGTPVATAISSRIYDYRSSTQSPLVDFCGWLDVEGGAPVRDAECPDLAICGETADWTVITRPYLLTCDLRICSTGALNVGPGVEVRSVLASPTLDFHNQGVLAVGGTEGGEVRFTSDAETPGAGDWSGLRLRPGSTNTIERATIDHAVNAVYVYDTSATLDHVETTGSTRGVYVQDDATVDIHALTSHSNTDGLYVFDGNSTVTVTGSTLTDNNRYGVYLDGDVLTTAPQVNISGSSIHSNDAAYDLYTYRFQNAGQEVVLARDNWWGTPDATAISSRIYDYRSSTQSPLVDFCGWLDVEGGAPVRDAECPDLAICGETADWTVTTRPYLLTCDLRICSTGALNVGPGVEVRSVLASPTLDFHNQGVLAVGGTEGGEVRFTSDAQPPGADDWSGLRLRPGSTNTIERATIDHAVNAVYVYDTAATLDHVETTHSTRGVYVEGDATVDISHLTSRFNTDGLYVYDGNSTVTVTGSTLTGNNRYGVYLNGDVLTTAPQVTISGSSIHSNLAAYDLYTYRYQNSADTIVWVTDNWWGTSDPVAIEARIYDHDDQTQSPRVYYQAFGDQCAMALGRDRDLDGHPDFDDNCPDVGNGSQVDGDQDGMGDPCDPEPATVPWDVCDGFEDMLDGYADADGDGWGDPCDHQPLRDDSYPGAPELCDARDNDGDGFLGVDERIDEDMDLDVACGDCDDLEPLANVCLCEVCGNTLDDDCDGVADGGDLECVDYPSCVVVETGTDPWLTMAKGECGGATLSGPYDVIRGSLGELAFDAGHVDLGAVSCVAGGLDWDRVTDWSLNPNPRCETMPVLFYLGQNTGDSDFGTASGGEPRDTMTPDPACP